MKYRITFKHNPKLYLLVLAATIVPIIGIILLFFITILGIILLILGFFISFNSLRFLSGLYKSYIHTYDDGITFQMIDKNIFRYKWQEINITGLVKQENVKLFYFLYNESDDKLLKVPFDYENIESLEIDLKNNSDYKIYDLTSDETIEDKIKEVLNITSDKE